MRYDIFSTIDFFFFVGRSINKNRLYARNHNQHKRNK